MSASTNGAHRRLVIVGCAMLLALALGTLAYHDVFTFRWSDLFDPYVVKEMWSCLDQVRVPRSGWLASACLLAMAAQGLALARARRRHRRWRAIQQAWKVPGTCQEHARDLFG
jgi:hypothetical protein